jgi:hypothetical protein
LKFRGFNYCFEHIIHGDPDGTVILGTEVALPLKIPVDRTESSQQFVEKIGPAISIRLFR